MKKPLKDIINDDEYIYPKNILDSEEDRQEPPPVNKVRCPVCGKLFTKRNRYAHRRTQYHQIYEKINNKFLGHLISE